MLITYACCTCELIASVEKRVTQRCHTPHQPTPAWYMHTMTIICRAKILKDITPHFTLEEKSSQYSDL